MESGKDIDDKLYKILINVTNFLGACETNSKSIINSNVCIQIIQIVVSKK